MAAQPSLTLEELKYLEQTRQRLHQLTNNIASLKQDVIQNSPLPNWSVNPPKGHSLQASAVILAGNIQALTAHLSKHSDLLNRTVIYPTPDYPGREHEGLLGQLLRKKLEPSVEKWVEKAKEVAESSSNTEEQEEFKSWAADWISLRIANYAQNEAGDEYTVEEREKGIETVRTGLKSSSKATNNSEDEEDGDEDG
ncbi:Mediator of RNA polymerase II transcription subunit 8 [Golovinomyces cichoracearum]|uniref:Mediator of RNA polymerase II transcription subunit 8 n=1 Tax=Golovinomyces cichoracearum TaxID=62708 RepID=A0A420I0U5_9PEZI|nr:Mediator of RNA polymerase II transcription subunit 8 [Golovinomyces cichoracearum]